MHGRIYRNGDVLLMRTMCEKEIEDVIFDRCKAWWDGMVDNTYTDMMENREELFAYLQYFKKMNETYTKKSNKIAWIQVDTIINELEVCVDRQEEEDMDMWERLVQCLDHLWKAIEVARM